MSIHQASRIRRIRHSQKSLSYGLNLAGMLLRYGYVNQIAQG